jgi:hypothetical protein
MEGRVVFIFAPSIFCYYILIPKTYISSVSLEFVDKIKNP